MRHLLIFHFIDVNDVEKSWLALGDMAMQTRFTEQKKITESEHVSQIGDSPARSCYKVGEHFPITGVRCGKHSSDSRCSALM
jgi:hypothetical protein